MAAGTPKRDQLQGDAAELRAELVELRRQFATILRRHEALASIQASDPATNSEAQALAQFAITVVGGHEAALGELDECAALGGQKPLYAAGFFCSGTLIQPSVIVSAAHCGAAGSSATPIAAALQLTDINDLTSAEIIAGRFVSNPAFTGAGPNDIAVMLLKGPSIVTPVAVATTAEMTAATEVILAGFGAANLAGTLGEGVKRSATVPIQFLKGGLKNDPSAVAGISFDQDLEFVAGVSGTGACFGDSGGPAYVTVGGLRKLAGVISRPPSRQKPICKGYTILTRIDQQAAWLQSVIP